MIERVDVSTLLEAAPKQLIRTGNPLVTELFTLPVLGLDRWRKIDPETGKLVEQLSSSGPNLILSHVTAKCVLQTALEVPKSVYDTDGKWYHYAPNELVEFIKINREGRKHKPGYEQESLAKQSSKWSSEIGKRHNIWEFGVIIQTPTDIKVLSISTPWDRTNFGWYERLTPKEIFVGRQKELSMLKSFIEDATGEKFPSDAERAFRATDEEIWWGEAGNLNKILTGHYQSINGRIGIPFGKRVVKILEKQGGTKQIHEQIVNATRISGYFISMFRDRDTGEMSPEFYIDTQNWLQTSDNKAGKTLVEPEKLDDKYKWIESNGYLRNSDWSFRRGDEPNGTFSVLIFLPDKNGGEVGIEIKKYLKLNSKVSRAFIYRVNHSLYGDTSQKDGWEIANEKALKPLTKEDWKIIEKTFEEAIARAQVDDQTYRYTKRNTGLTQQTQDRLDSARAMLQEKMKIAGVK